MRKFLLLIMAAAMAFTAAAQVSVKGTVNGPQQQPLQGATVTLFIQNSKTATAVTGNNGSFEFANIKINTACRLTVQYTGKKTAEQSFTTGESNNFTFTLEDLVYFLEPLEVRSVRAADKAPFTKTDLTAQAIAKTNLGQDIPYLINQTPSVYVSSDAGNGVGYTSMHIRGVDGTRINVTLNGIPYNDAESQGSYFVDVPDLASSAGSIQIQRGVGTSTNGAGAFGATMNISTNEFNPQAYAESNNSFGSFNTWKNTVKLGSGLINNHFTIDARLSQVSSNGYIDRASTNLQSMYLSTAYIGKKTSVRFNFLSGKEKTYQAWYGIDSATLATNRRYNPAGTEKPGSPYNNETDNYWQQHYQLFINQDLGNAWKLNIASFLTRGYGYYEEYRGVDAETAAGDATATAYATYGLPNPIYGKDTITNTDLIRQLWLDNYFYGQTFSLQYRKGKEDIALGGSWTVYDGKHTDKLLWAQNGGIPDNYVYANFPARKTDANVYAKWLHSLNNRWNLFGDVQYRHVMHRIDGFEDYPNLFIKRSFDFVNPKAGVSYNHGGWNAYLSYAQANKEPNRDDFKANPQQQPSKETLHDVELGIEYKKPGYNWGITLYDMIYRDQLVLTGKINDVGSATRINVPNSYRLGIELQGGYTFAKWVNATANLTLSRNKIKNFTEYLTNYDDGSQQAIAHSNTDISFSPSVIGAFSINFLPVKNLEISLPGKYVGKQYLDNTQNNLRTLGSFYTQDARISYTVNNKLFKQWTIIGQVNNIFNTLYEPNGAAYPYIYGGAVVNSNYYYPVAGTNFMMAVNVKF
jgi:iron complex outermembrane receptor protein